MPNGGRTGEIEASSDSFRAFGGAPGRTCERLATWTRNEKRQLVPTSDSLPGERLAVPRIRINTAMLLSASFGAAVCARVALCCLGRSRDVRIDESAASVIVLYKSRSIFTSQAKCDVGDIYAMSARSCRVRPRCRTRAVCFFLGNARVDSRSVGHVSSIASLLPARRPWFLDWPRHERLRQRSASRGRQRCRRFERWSRTHSAKLFRTSHARADAVRQEMCELPRSERRRGRGPAPGRFATGRATARPAAGRARAPYALHDRAGRSRFRRPQHAAQSVRLAQ